MSKLKPLNFQRRDVGEMTKAEFVHYFNSWHAFMREVSTYGESLETMCKILGFRE